MVCIALAQIEGVTARIGWLVLGSVLVGHAARQVLGRRAGSTAEERMVLVLLWQLAHSFGPYLFVILWTVVWPTFLVYKGFQRLVG